mmetsp:Transcript_41776/g.97466  ORF Transcript_41776/g.97466 Transcript_41776/m.97466 type:complete len:222 (-) Transcript_41776:399-1064(-)
MKTNVPPRILPECHSRDTTHPPRPRTQVLPSSLCSMALTLGENLCSDPFLSRMPLAFFSSATAPCASPDSPLQTASEKRALTKNNCHIVQHPCHTVVGVTVQADVHLVRLHVLLHRPIKLAFAGESLSNAVESIRHIHMLVAKHSPEHAKHLLTHSQRIVQPPLTGVDAPQHGSRMHHLRLREPRRVLTMRRQAPDPKCLRHVHFRPLEILLIQQQLPELE